MGHIRLGLLPTSKQWREVVELLRTGSSVDALAGATASAAEAELRYAAVDPALTHTVWLLAQLPLAARSSQFSSRLSELGFDPGAEESLLSLISALTTAIDKHVGDRQDRTDLGEMARLAAAESLNSIVGAGLPSLFHPHSDDVRAELGKLASKKGFARLARDFFSRLTLKVLEYYLSRELPNHVGPDRAISSIDKQIDFRAALERHCREASLIVEDFAGGWYSKANYRGPITPDHARSFADYALKKIRDELHARRASDD